MKINFDNLERGYVLELIPENESEKCYLFNIFADSCLKIDGMEIAIDFEGGVTIIYNKP